MSAGTAVRRVAVTTIGRGADLTSASGNLRVVDLERSSVTFKVAVPESRWRAEDPNPRGGTRGGRGVAVHDDRFVLGTHEDITVVDTHWNPVLRFTHPILSAIHDVVADERGMWVSCTRGDSVALLDWSGRLVDWWSLGLDRRLAKTLNLHLVRRFDPKADYRDPRIDLQGWSTVGVNGLGRGPSGFLVSLGRVADRRKRVRLPFRKQPRPDPASFAIVALPADGRLRDTAATILLHRTDHPVDAPNHNAAEEGGLLLYNDSNRNAFVVWDRVAGREVKTVPIPGDSPFVRGLCRVSPGRWLVGSQKPLALYEIDVEDGEIVATHDLEGDEEETVYAICELPDRFDDPAPAEGSDSKAFWDPTGVPAGVTPIPRRR
ncbi:MAG TPA: hypothetical protein VLJ76_12090 [Gaiellaceae bacterium]|nr:hypothetical protein [Gaiellaceae bacterium]